MILIISKKAKEEGAEKVEKALSSLGYKAEILSRYERWLVRVSQDVNDSLHLKFIRSLPEVEKVEEESPYLLVTRKFKPEDTIISIGDISIGETPLTIAGPCAVESYSQVKEIASFLKKCGVRILRGGAYKLRTSPYSFQGLEVKGLEMLRKVADELGMYVITEAVDTDSFSCVEEYADIIQIGARNMQNFSLLKRAGKAKRPVLLKRGFMSTIDEFLSAAEYIILHGNQNVILCERGIRTYETRTRFTLDISAIPVLKELTHLPVMADPSRAAGKRSLVLPLARASIAAGADGPMVEVHNNPEMALSDGKQSLTFKMFEELTYQLNKSPLYRKEKVWPFMEASFS